MFLRSVRMQTAGILRKKTAAVTYLLLMGFVLVNFFLNLWQNHEAQYVTQMFDPVKILTLSDWSYSGFYMRTYFPLLVVLPTACSYLSDRQTRMQVYMEARTGRTSYWMGKFLAVFLATFIIFTLPFLLELALKKGVLISFDPNLRFSLWDDAEALKQTVHEFLPYADILKLSDEELEFITGKNDIEEALPFLFSHRCKCVVYTQGKDGATLYRRNDHISAKGHQVQVVDTTGAGDSFIGAFLYCLLTEESDDLEAIPLERMKHHLEFANLYAAHTTTMAGALAAMADQEQLREFHHALYDDDDDSSLYL